MSVLKQNMQLHRTDYTSTVVDGKFAESGGGAARAFCAAKPHKTVPRAAKPPEELTFCYAKCKTRAAPTV